MNKITPWFLSALLTIACGMLVLAYLVAPPSQIGWYLAMLAGVLFIWGILAWRFFRKWELAVDVALLLALFVTGYLSATLFYLAQTENGEVPVITRIEGDPGDGHTAILYFTHGEPPAYNPMPWIETFHELD